MSEKLKQTAFDIVFAMEDDILHVHGYGQLLARFSDTVDDDEARPLHVIAMGLIACAKSLEERHDVLFRELHPRRDELNAEEGIEEHSA